jgi:uncharacterized coiled-coil protein SlyX
MSGASLDRLDDYLDEMKKKEKSMGTAPEVEERLVDLELRFMKLERYALDLSHAVADQQRTIDALTAETKRLREQRIDEEPAPRSDPPPHY